MKYTKRFLEIGIIDQISENKHYNIKTSYIKPHRLVCDDNCYGNRIQNNSDDKQGKD